MALNLNPEISDGDRYVTWVQVVERVYSEQSGFAWNYYMFRLFRTVFANNKNLSEKGGFILDWVTRIYVDSTLMLVRRELDKQTGVENIRNLLSDIVKFPSILNRKRYREYWGKTHPLDKNRPDRIFDSFKLKQVSENREEDHIDPKTVQIDLDQVVSGAEKIREYAERTRAHRSPKQTVSASEITFRSLHEAVSGVIKTILKYHALLTLTSTAELEPTPQFDTIAPFMEPWCIDRDVIDQAVRKGNKE